MSYSHSCKRNFSFGLGLHSAEELQTPEALQQSVASGARFVIQHLPPLEGSFDVKYLTSRSLAPLSDRQICPHRLERRASRSSSSCAFVGVRTRRSNQGLLFVVADKQPHVSFPCLIALAILDSPAQKLTVSEIYEWIKVPCMHGRLNPGPLPVLRHSGCGFGMEELRSPQPEP
jgi:hypothetical protein